MTFELFDGEPEIVEEVLVGVGDAAVGGAHPDGLGVEIGEDAVAGFAGDEGFFVLLALRDVDGEAAEVRRHAVLDDDLCAAFDPANRAIGSADLKIRQHLSPVSTARLMSQLEQRRTRGARSC